MKVHTPEVVAHSPSDVEHCCFKWEEMEAKQQQRSSLIPMPSDSLRSFLAESCSLKGTGRLGEKVEKILKALVVYDHARHLTRITPTTNSVIIATQEGSSRDRALLDATDSLVRHMIGAPVTCQDQNRILTGPKGMGKSYIL